VPSFNFKPRPDPARVGPHQTDLVPASPSVVPPVVSGAALPEREQENQITNASAIGRITVGAPTITFEPKVVDPIRFRPPYRPDSLIDGWSTDAFYVRAASVRGDDHRFRGKPRQDEFVLGFHPMTGCIVIAVADGVSGAPQSHLGATAACRYSVDAILGQLDAGTDIDWSALLKGAAWAVVETAQRAAGASEPDPNAAENLCATTLVAALVRPTSTGSTVTGISVGDSGMLSVSYLGFKPIAGGKAPEDGVSSSAVSGLPRVPSAIAEQRVDLAVGEVLLVATDGILDPLGTGRGLVGQLFYKNLAAPPDPMQFCRLVDFSRETFDDDRTLVAVWRRGDEPVPQGPASRTAAAPRPTAKLPGESPSGQ
jgi:hypothetical protein